MDSKSTRNILIAVSMALIVIIGALLVLLKPAKKTEVKPSEPFDQKIEMETETQEKPQEITEFSGTEISLMDYRVFDFEDIDFKFVIAKLHIKCDEPINISLDHFKTSEDLKLNEVDKFVAELEKHSYFLGRQNVWFSIISSKTETDANIFIPIQNKKSSAIKLVCDFNDSKEFSLNVLEATGEKESLQYMAEDVISDGKTYQMTVLEAKDITGEYIYENYNGEEFEYYVPSTTKVYAFKVNAISLWGDEIVIEQAKYMPNTTSEVFDAVDANIRTMKYSNIIGRSIKDNDSGYLFFVAYDPDTNPVTYTGVLKLKVANQENWITVNVDLN